jgi:hypothetical protein
MRFDPALGLCAAVILVVMPLVAGELAPQKDAAKKTAVTEKSVQALHNMKGAKQAWPDTEMPKKAAPSDAGVIAARPP